MAISAPTRKLLWGQAGNRCAICRCELTRTPLGSKKQTILGEEAHLVAQRPGGARAGEPVPGDERDGFANLMLLCPNDHRLIDDQPEVYPLPRLVAMKAAHEAWVRDVLEANRGSEPEAARLLDELLARSLARCVERWQALGLNRDDAVDLANDRSVGSIDRIDPGGRPLLVLHGDVGSGKSLFGERWHQRAIAAARASSDAPVPVWLRARDVASDLERAVAEASPLSATGTGRSVELVIDGLDEVGVAAATDVLRQARELAQVRKGNRVLLTTRWMTRIGNDDERVSLPLLAEAESGVLVARLAGRERFVPGGLAPALLDAIKRPLFAIALGRLLAENETYSPSTPAEIVDRLVRIAIGSRWSEVRAPLKQLAVRSLDESGAAVRSTDVVAPHVLERLLETRLVVEDSGRLRFPLIVFAQWFAAQAVVDGEVDVGELAASPDAELWRYPFAVSLASSSTARAAEIAGEMVAASPGFASIVLSESTRQHGSRNAPIAHWREAGDAIREAADSWITALGPLGQRIGPTRDGAQLPLGVRVDGERLSTGWYRGEQDRDAVFELPSDFFPFDAPDYGPARTGPPDSAAAWAWRWTRDELARRLEAMVKELRIGVAGTALEHEAVWATALRVLDHGSLHRGPIDVSWLLQLADDVDGVLVGGRVIDVRGLQPILAEHASADGSLFAPWPGPDRSRNSGWVWSDYSAAAVKARAEAVYGAALSAYTAVTSALLPTLAPLMTTAAAQPARITGTLYFRDTDATSHPLLDWRLEATDGAVGAAFELGVEDERAVRFASMSARNETLRSKRPSAARWISAIEHGQLLDIFGASPGAELMHTWLRTDLARLGWVATSFGGTPTTALPRLIEPADS